MPINLIDNFRLSSAIPLDGRVVATGPAARDAMAWKYDGLRVFQSDTRTTYVWNAPAFATTGVTATSWDVEYMGFQGPQGRSGPQGWQGGQGWQGVQGGQGWQGPGFTGVVNPEPNAILTATASSSDTIFAQPLLTFDGSSLTLRNGLGLSGPTAAAGFQLYSSEVAPGNAAPHFRTEDGGVVKLYGQSTSVGPAAHVPMGGTAIGDTDTFDGYTLAQVVRALKNLGILT